MTVATTAAIVAATLMPPAAGHAPPHPIQIVVALAALALGYGVLLITKRG